MQARPRPMLLPGMPGRVLHDPPPAANGSHPSAECKQPEPEPEPQPDAELDRLIAGRQVRDVTIGQLAIEGLRSLGRALLLVALGGALVGWWMTWRDVEIVRADLRAAYQEIQEDIYDAGRASVFEQAWAVKQGTVMAAKRPPTTATEEPQPTAPAAASRRRGR